MGLLRFVMGRIVQRLGAVANNSSFSFELGRKVKLCKAGHTTGIEQGEVDEMPLSSGQNILPPFICRADGFDFP
jgi:hypothetical protein